MRPAAHNSRKAAARRVGGKALTRVGVSRRSSLLSLFSHQLVECVCKGVDGGGSTRKSGDAR